MTLGFFTLIKGTSRYRVTRFNRGWNVVLRGETYYDVDLENFRIPGGIKKGEFIFLSNFLPFSMNDGSAVVFPLTLSTISVDVKGSAIYGYGSGEYAEGSMVGNAVHIIRVPDGSQGRQISIVIRAAENNAFSYLTGVVLDDTNWGFIDYLNDNIYPVSLSLSLVTAGLIILVISFILAVMDYEWERINQIGMLFFIVGCWNLCETNAVQLFSLNFKYNTYCRYFFGIISILPILRIISGGHSDKTKGEVIAQKAVFYLNQFIIFAVVALTLLNKIHICVASKFFQITGLTSIIIVAVIEWRRHKDKRNGANARFREFLVCFFFIIMEIVRYILNDQINFRFSVLRHSFLLYGSVFLVMMMMASYIYELYDAYLKRAEEKTLKKLAYTDGLTGLLNRAFCKDKMEELDKSDRDYHMISFDVDGLKKINDSRGHSEGDRLLITFADLLSRCFSDVADVIRPGGDEFLVISDEAGRQELIRRLQWLKSMEKGAGRSLEFPVHAAYGLAGRDEVQGHTTEEVYYLADQRMYQMKSRNR